MQNQDFPALVAPLSRSGLCADSLRHGCADSSLTRDGKDILCSCFGQDSDD